MQGFSLMQGLTVCPWSRVAKLSISYVSRTIKKPQKVARFVAAKVSYWFCRYSTCGYHKLSCWIVLYQVILLVIKKSCTNSSKILYLNRIVTVSPRFLMHRFRFLSRVTHLSTSFSCVIIYIYICTTYPIWSMNIHVWHILLHYKCR